MGIYRGQNFSPFTNYVISCSNSSTNQVVVQPTTGPQCTDIAVSNNTAVVAFVAWNTLSTAATAVASGSTMSYPILAGQTQVINCGGAVTNVAVILASSTGNVYVSLGTGT